MYIERTITTDYDGDTHSIMVKVDGVRRFWVMKPEPEDATFCRDLKDCLKVVDLMREAHAAGARGEPFEVKDVEEES